MKHHSDTLLDKICEILEVSYNEEFDINGITFKIIPYCLLRKYPYSDWQVEHFENILEVKVDSQK